MKSIGVRELRQRASVYLRLVAAGEIVQINDRGQPVALLVPVPLSHPLELLTATGRLDRARGDLLDLGHPLPPRPGAPLPSDVLRTARHDER